MTREEEKKVEKEVLNEVANAFEFDGIDIFQFDKKTVDLIFRGFQIGIGYWEKKRKEIEKLKEIPF